ncbi:phytanoyl-CoA dioxygenase PhyH [Novosphingobium taihuense]|nr:phytanoyl-CoA dioxygenase family protein [Novosphingobium taihuense]TWH85463.1 phytanoyl-CoA dioxygenase PhyH [Novosphingobium taihuense]
MAQIGRFTAEQAPDAAQALARDGVIVFDQLFDPALIAKVAGEVRRVVPGAYDIAARRPEDLLKVGDRRINGLVPIGRSMSNVIDMLLSPAFQTLFDQALGRGWVYESFGVISSFPGAPSQRIHSDDAHLFEDTPFAGSLPAYALTISIPLVEVNAVNGGTEFLLGTHRLEWRESYEETPVTSPLQPGDCMIWDFMVRHRGQANNSDAARPMLYVTACRPFWTDYTNFKPDARKLVVDRKLVLGLPDEQRKRFKRFRPMPGLRTGLVSFSRVLRWYAPELHQGLMKHVLRRGSFR